MEVNPKLRNKYSLNLKRLQECCPLQDAAKAVLVHLHCWGSIVLLGCNPKDTYVKLVPNELNRVTSDHSATPASDPLGKLCFIQYATTF